jgi:hypothetical protein
MDTIMSSHDELLKNGFRQTHTQQETNPMSVKAQVSKVVFRDLLRIRRMHNGSHASSMKNDFVQAAYTEA